MGANLRYLVGQTWRLHQLSRNSVATGVTLGHRSYRATLGRLFTPRFSVESHIGSAAAWGRFAYDLFTIADNAEVQRLLSTVP